MANSSKPRLILAALLVLFTVIALFQVWRQSEMNRQLRGILEAQHKAAEGRIASYDDLIKAFPQEIKSTPALTDKRFSWPAGQKVAVSLTYDDGYETHFKDVAISMAQRGLRATFYPIGHRSVIEHPQQWARVSQLGHELGNHSLFHPCRRPSINPAYHLANYNQTRWYDEMTVANYILNSIDNQTHRTLAYPCAQKKIGPAENPVPVTALVPRLFYAARSYADGQIIRPDYLDLYNLPSYAADLHLKDFKGIRSIIDEAQKYSGWVIFTFHDINKEPGELVFDNAEHQQLISFLAQNQDKIWTAPLIEVCRHLRSLGY